MVAQQAKANLVKHGAQGAALWGTGGTDHHLKLQYQRYSINGALSVSSSPNVDWSAVVTITGVRVGTTKATLSVSAFIAAALIVDRDLAHS